MAELIADPFRAARLILSLRQNGITSPAVLKAMETIDRGSFAAPDYNTLAFEDVHLPLPCGQSIAPPIVTGQILAALDYSDSRQGRALLIGAGSGYSSALLAPLVEHVVAAERSERLAEMAQQRLSDLGVGNVEVRHADGLTGCPMFGPYDFIIAMGAMTEIPDPVFDALARDGQLTAPVGTVESVELQVWQHGRCTSREPLLSPLLPLRDGLCKAI
ncbi:MAG: methyltransferase domain-containing protein [Pseudomonadota bacterium]